MINFNLFAPTHTNFGPNVTLIGQLWGKSSSGPVEAVTDLTINWHDLPANHSTFALLSWHTRLSDFHGRTAERDQLYGWASSPQSASIKFLTGDGKKTKGSGLNS